MAVASHWQTGGLNSVLAALNAALAAPFALRWTEHSARFLLLFTLTYAVAAVVLVSDKCNTRPGAEHGSACWGDVSALNRKYRDKATALHYPRVWLYARTGSGHRSVAERQLKELREWATCNGYCVVGQSCECAKANSFWHPGLFSMLRAVRRGNVDTVAVTRLSRFAVHKSKLCYVLSVLQKNGVVIHTSNCQLKYDLYLHGLDRVLVG